MQKQMESKTKSNILVGLQMTCIILLLVMIPMWEVGYIALIVATGGFFLGCWAVVSMKLDNLSVRPDVRQNARLVKSGPYRVIRHPMYTAVLLTLTPLIVDHPSTYGIIVWIVLLLTLLYKLNYEERLLKNHFEGYASYMLKSWRIIPYIY
ncbi:MAG: isoprenylcysteine carboxylmethyltransferase family protein [Bacteroidetes bacterium]|nr:isoprenylcysteine carboxylmethyltransferase family protein [Bacteroidota bacterium]